MTEWVRQSGCDRPCSWIQLRIWIRACVRACILSRPFNALSIPPEAVVTHSQLTHTTIYDWPFLRQSLTKSKLKHIVLMAWANSKVSIIYTGGDALNTFRDLSVHHRRVHTRLCFWVRNYIFCKCRLTTLTQFQTIKCKLNIRQQNQPNPNQFKFIHVKNM